MCLTSRALKAAFSTSFALGLMAAPLSASAELIQLTISEKGAVSPTVFKFPVNEDRHQVDLREDHAYTTAFRDSPTGKEICRAGHYQTGLLFTLRRIRALNDLYTYELVGQITQVQSIDENDVGVSCGKNQKVNLTHRGFSDVVEVDARAKVIVIDGTWTILFRKD